MALLMNQSGYFTAWDDSDAAERTAELFDDQEVRSFVLVHESGGESWFNKERLELLLRWLFLAEMSGDLSGRVDTEELLVRMTLLHKGVEIITAAAEKARYRPEPFLALLEKRA